MKKKGISLIVLVITIVVIIILAAAVILSLGKNNPINDAKKAKIAQTIDNFKSDLSLQVANKLLKDPMISVTEIDSDETREGFKLTDLIPSIKGTEYEDDFVVIDGKLKLKEGTDLPEETQYIIKEYIGEKVETPTTPETPTLETYTITYNLDGGIVANPTEYTVETETFTLTNPTKVGYVFAGWIGTDITEAQMTVQIEKGSTGNKSYIAVWNRLITPEIIKSAPQTYIGAQVEYSGYSESTNAITWRIYNVTDVGTVQLITNDYVDLTYKGTNPVTNVVVNGYSIKSSDNRDTLISYLTSQSNWSEYAVSGKTTAVGAPTVEEFCSSYKLKYPNKYLECKLTTAGSTEYITSGAAADGYVLRFNEDGANDVWTYLKAIGTSDDLYIKIGTSYVTNTVNGSWLGSASAYATNDVMTLDHNGDVVRAYYDYTNASARPLVSLTNAVLVEKSDGTIVVE